MIFLSLLPRKAFQIITLARPTWRHLMASSPGFILNTGPGRGLRAFHTPLKAHLSSRASQEGKVKPWGSC